MRSIIDNPTIVQQKAAEFDLHKFVFLKGPASSGKTSAALLRLQNLIEHGQTSTLVLVPQRSLAQPYQRFLRENGYFEGERVSIQTMSSLVRRMIALFWPLISSEQIYAHPYEQPRFLTLETSQYYMAQIVKPMIDQGSFNNITLPLPRLYTQLIDNLNKSALVGFPHTEIGSRLSSAFIGDIARQNVFADVQQAISQFRALCLRQNLVDFSLQVELFCQVIWPNRTFQKYLNNQYEHLIYDNAEEDPPYVHDLVAQWLESLQSALIIHDNHAGYRSFLGADPASSLRLEQHCSESFTTDDNFISVEPLQSLGVCLRDINNCQPSSELLDKTIWFPPVRLTFFPELLEELTKQIEALRGQPGGQDKKIAILAPFVSDNLRFSLTHQLEALGLQISLQKPSAPLRDDPAIKTLVVLAKLSHPTWGLKLSFPEIAAGLTKVISGLDLVRAHLLLGDIDPDKLYFSELPEAKVSDRVSEEITRQYELLRSWLLEIDPAEPLDGFLSRLFSELLSQPGYLFEQDIAAGTSTAVLMESFRKFTQSLDQSLQVDRDKSAKAFIEALDSGMIAATYLSDWETKPGDNVLIAPVTSYLMRNEPVDYQFWLNVGSKGWYERLEQPLTHPIVLSRHWQTGKLWTADEESAYNQANLQRILSGLLLRCREKVFAFSTEFNEAGIEERGQLLTLFNTLFRKALRGKQ
ncbi:MAG: DEAD/DEAH box helicase family protein [Chloroflexi bacterium]|nr:DEAD/DEAH box helicase family protein [Chloroflexota bacterium]